MQNDAVLEDGFVFSAHLTEPDRGMREIVHFVCEVPAQFYVGWLRVLLLGSL